MFDIKTNSKEVKKGDTFVALKGFNEDGHNYIEEAIKLGAKRIICEHGEYEVETIKVKDTNEWLHDYLVSNYKDEINKLNFIGVTGTNGKTTTCYLTYQQLNKLGVKACYIGTLGFYINDEVFPLNNTTPDILELYKMFMYAKNNGMDTVVMEVSSHALDFKRIEGVEFTKVAFTNLTEDHLDYHENMDNYLHAKLKILDYLKDDGEIIVNNDSPYAKYFKQKHFKTIGFNKSDLQIEKYYEKQDGTIIDFKYLNNYYIVKTNLCSKFNVYNYLTSLFIVNSLGYSIDKIIDISLSLEAPKGRCESINYLNNKIVIDYAHTPDAVLNVISAFKSPEHKIITIIGCGGDRDPFKRPLMGKIATELSDIVIFTSDNPRTENQDKIIEDILKGVKKGNYMIKNNRRDAIQKGIDYLTDNYILLILGKGHENYQIIGKTKYHFDDREEVETYLKEKNANNLTKKVV